MVQLRSSDNPKRFCARTLINFSRYYTKPCLDNMKQFTAPVQNVNNVDIFLYTSFRKKKTTALGTALFTTVISD